MISRKLEVVRRQDSIETWEAFIDGEQIGQYPSERSAKSACKRRLHSSTPRIEWAFRDGEWVAYA